jgi:hypothetical protein
MVSPFSYILLTEATITRRNCNYYTETAITMRKLLSLSLKFAYSSFTSIYVFYVKLAPLTPVFYCEKTKKRAIKLFQGQRSKK